MIPESGRSPGEGNGNPLQYSLPGKSMGSERVGHDLVTKTIIMGGEEMENILFEDIPVDLGFI